MNYVYLSSGIRKRDCTEYKPDAISNVYNTIARYRRDEIISSYNIKKDVNLVILDEYWKQKENP